MADTGVINVRGDDSESPLFLYDEPENAATQTPILNRYCFWYHKRNHKNHAAQASANPTAPAAANAKSTTYEENMTKIANFQTVEHFWRIYDHLVRPCDLKVTTDFHLFKEGIKPTWEDPQNENGGKWIVRLKKGLASRYWEEILLSVIGEQFDVGHEICGAVLSVRANEDILSVWNRNADNTEAKNKIRDHMKKILRLPNFVQLEYKGHKDSLTDGSSFRNTHVWKATINSRAANWAADANGPTGTRERVPGTTPRGGRGFSEHSPRGGLTTGYRQHTALPPGEGWGSDKPGFSERSSSSGSAWKQHGATLPQVSISSSLGSEVPEGATIASPLVTPSGEGSGWVSRSGWGSSDGKSSAESGDAHQSRRVEAGDKKITPRPRTNNAEQVNVWGRGQAVNIVSAGAETA